MTENHNLYNTLCSVCYKSTLNKRSLPSRLLLDVWFGADDGQKHLRRNHLVSVRVSKGITILTMLSSRLNNVVSGIPVVSDFINRTGKSHSNV